MDGMSMLFKAMGIDPEEIAAFKASIPQFANEVKTKIASMDESMKQLATGQVDIHNKLDLILGLITTNTKSAYVEQTPMQSIQVPASATDPKSSKKQ